MRLCDRLVVLAGPGGFFGSCFAVLVGVAGRFLAFFPLGAARATIGVVGVHGLILLVVGGGRRAFLAVISGRAAIQALIFLVVGGFRRLRSGLAVRAGGITGRRYHSGFLVVGCRCRFGSGLAVFVCVRCGFCAVIERGRFRAAVRACGVDGFVFLVHLGLGGVLLAVITGYGAVEGFVFLVPLAVNGFLAGLAVGAGDVAFAVITLALFAFNLVVGFGGFALEALGAGRAVEALGVGVG